MHQIEKRLEISKEAYIDKESIKSLAIKHGVKIASIYNWRKLYKKSVDGFDLTPKLHNQNYSELSETALRQELMKKDIEIARLKKGYMVKGGGANKEFVTSSD